MNKIFNPLFLLQRTIVGLIFCFITDISAVQGDGLYRSGSNSSPNSGSSNLHPWQGYEIKDFDLKTTWEKSDNNTSQGQQPISPQTRPEDHWDFSRTGESKEPIFEPVNAEAEPRDLYRLKIGDRLLISIYGEQSTERDVLVDSAGEITYPVAGTITAIGKTIDELRSDLNAKIATQFQYTFVNITPEEFGGENYTILGQVNQPGSKVIYGQETLLSAICRAGGFPLGQYRANDIDLADLERAFLLRHGSYLPVDFKALVYDGDLRQNIELKGGDYIYIPSALDRQIFVLGEVGSPSVLSFINTLSLVEAMAQVGGLTPNASSRLVVIRGKLCEPYTYTIDIMRIFKGCDPDFQLQPGDIVYVPPRQFSYLRNLVRSAIMSFVSSFAAEASSLAFQSVFNTTAPLQNINIIPAGTSNQVIVFPTTVTPTVVP